MTDDASQRNPFLGDMRLLKITIILFSSLSEFIPLLTLSQSLQLSVDMLSRVKKDLIEAISNPIPGFSIMLSGEDFSEWIIRLTPCNGHLGGAGPAIH